MVDKKVIEKKLAELFDIVPETEGLIVSDLDGKVIIGQTITDMNHSAIAKTCVAIIKYSSTMGDNISKGGFQAATVDLENGYAVIVKSDAILLIALSGLDGKASLSLLKRNLISISKI